MKTSILGLVNQSKINKNAFVALENIFTLYEQLQYATNIKEVAFDIFTWLESNYKLQDMVFSLFDICKNSKINILSKGNDFFLDDDLSHFFIINTHTNLNATISFCASSKEHSVFIEDNYDSIESAFFLISPIVQNSILKKVFIDSSSLDSVTNIYTRDYFIENLSSYLKISNNKQQEIFLLMIGIDSLEEFNYEISNKILIELAKVIHSNINEFDMVGRLESDVFLVSILSNEDEYQAYEVAKKIINDFSKTKIVIDEKTNQAITKTACIGFETFKIDENKTLDEAIKSAEISLVEAKNKGKNQLFKLSRLNTINCNSIFT